MNTNYLGYLGIALAIWSAYECSQDRMATAGVLFVLSLVAVLI